MGQGIAQVTALAGYKTHLYDIDSARVRTAVESIRQITDRLVQKGKLLNEARSEMLGSLLFCSMWYLAPSTMIYSLVN